MEQKKHTTFTPKKKVSNQRYRSKLSPFSLSITQEEKEMIRQCAKAEGKSMNSYVRMKLGLSETALGEGDSTNSRWC